MSEADGLTAEQGRMDIDVSGFVHSAESDIIRLQQILREGYPSGFTIFKELLQNAEDAGARRLVVAGHCGFNEATNPLIQAPGLIIANDGDVLERHMAAIKRASGGSKADERSAVGRFGLGQKSVYHLCDAFIALGWIQDKKGQPQVLVMNPWEKISGAAAASREWAELSPVEAKILVNKAKELGLGGGMLLFLPLRTANLRPGPSLCLSEKNWEPDAAIKDIFEDEELPATLSCLRNLEQIEILPVAGEARTISMRTGAQRLSGPGVGRGAPKINGSVDGAGFALSFNGRQQWVQDGEVARLLTTDGWDKVFDIRGEQIPPKADPHGAVILCRSSAREGAGHLRVRNAVYLPVGRPLSEERLEYGTNNIDLLVHGHFFVSSDRQKLRTDDHIETRWNEALSREVALPLLLEAVADVLALLPDDRERYGLVRALAKTQWWSEHRTEICQGRALARCWPGGAAEKWQVWPNISLRPIKRNDATSLARLKAAFPAIEEWCGERAILLAFGTGLDDSDPRWPDEQFAELIRLAGPASFQKSQVAETLAAVLDGTQLGEVALAALAENLRDAIGMVEHNFAAAEKLKPLIRHLPDALKLVLPPSVENRDLLRALSAAGKKIPVKANWSQQGEAVSTTLGLGETIELLNAAEPFLSLQGSVVQEASALISHLLRNGPSLEMLATDSRASALRVIPARMMQAEEEVRLSLGEIAALKANGLLFDAAPNRELTLLAGAVLRPPIYRVTLKDGGLGDLASAKKNDCLLTVLRQVLDYGDPGKCGELANLLGEDVPKDELRRLVVQDISLPSQADLIELDELGGILDDIVLSLLKGRPERLVASATAAELKKNLRNFIGLRRIGRAELGTWLLDAHNADAMPPISDAGAIALLKSGIDDDILRVLPLHRTGSDQRLFSADSLFTGRPSDVAPALLPFIHIVELWGDNQAAAVQNRLIARWGYEATVRTALRAPDPHKFTSEIAAALAKIEHLPDDLVESLRDTPWIAAQGKAWAPLSLVDLPQNAEHALEKLIGGPSGLLFASKLPDCLRHDSVQRHLEKLAPNRSDSFIMAGRRIAEQGVTGFCVDPVEYYDDLATLADSNIDLDAQAWPLFSAAFRDHLAKCSLSEMAKPFGKVSPSNIVAQMNAMAAAATSGTNGEAARRLYQAAFKRNASALSEATGYLPPNMLVPTKAGSFARADTVALDAEGVDPKALFARNYADMLEPAADRKVEIISASPPAQADWLENIERVFTSLGQYDVHDAILLALAMLGRDDKVEALAAKWEGQRSFHRICDDIDMLADEQRDMKSANQDRFAELRFLVELPELGLAKVLSVAGSDCTVPLSGKDDALLLDCIPRGMERDDAGYRHVYSLVIGPVLPADADAARQLLNQFVTKLAPALMLGFERQKAAVSDLLASYFKSDQRTLEDTRTELKQVLYDRLAGIKTGPVMGEALSCYHRDAPRHPEEARNALWGAAQSDEGAAELLDAMRRKIGEMGYSPSRVIFELYQNAVDAQAQWNGNGRFRMEADYDANQKISCLRVIHWGRPINQPGSDAQIADQEGHRRDLANMLAINHSAKDGDRVTGRFGLGFKTAHMLTDEVRLASAGIALRILGGMIPADWPDGGRSIASRHDKGCKATLIELPVALGRTEDALEAWNAFVDAAPFLAALGREGTIEIMSLDGEKLFRHEENSVVEGVSWLKMDASRHLLRFDLGDDFRLFLPFGRHGPYKFPDDVPQFWHLVPLIGEARRGGWLIEGRLPVDPGRTQLSGTAEDKKRRFTQLGIALGQRLIDFYDYCMAGWSDFASATGLAIDGRNMFWQKLVELFMQDIGAHRPEQLMHQAGHGLALLLAKRPLVPLAFDGTTHAEDVKWHLAGALKSHKAQAPISNLLVDEQFKKTVVTDETANFLKSMGLPSGSRLDAITLAETLTVAGRIDAGLAERLYCLCEDEVLQAMLGTEQAGFRKFLREQLWLSEDKSWQNIRLLAFPQGDKEEQERAAFAPPSGRLSPGYTGVAFKLASFAREQAGHTLAVWEKWADLAGEDRVRQQAFIRYLASAEDRTVRHLAGAAKWLPPIDDLADAPLLNCLDQEEKNRLLAKLGYSFLPVPALTESDPSRFLQPDAQRALLGISEWWRSNKGVCRPDYNHAVYPEDFSFTALEEGDKSAWFTMLSLATFQTLGRIKPVQSRQFVTNAIQDGWWDDLATIDPSDETLRPFVERLREWSEPDADESYLIWRRCLPDLCMIARHLDQYRTLFLRLPAVVAQEGMVRLGTYLRPAFSDIAARMGIDAAPLAKSLGIGANWLVRELGRNHIYSQDRFDLVRPYSWSTARRVRQLASTIGMGTFEHGVDMGHNLYHQVERLIGDDVHFDGDGDLPLHVITLAKHRDDLMLILNNAGGGEWINNDWDEGDDDA